MKNLHAYCSLLRVSDFEVSNNYKSESIGLYEGSGITVFFFKC